MNTSSKPGRNRLWRWAGGVVPTLVALCLLVSPGRPLTVLSFDLLYLFRPTPDRAALAEVVILNMDEEARSALHQDPNREWERSEHARLLRELSRCKARVVVFDALFDEPSANAAADEQFAAAIREHGNVVLGESQQSSRNAGRPATSRLLRPLEMFDTNATTGIVEWPDEGGSTLTIRRTSNLLDSTNLSWQAAVAFGRVPPDPHAPRWLNFYGPGGTIPTVSYYRAFETNSLPPNFFAGKAVFVGKARIITADGQTRDHYATPFSRWRGGQTSGVELQATAFLNLVRREWLQELSPLAEFLLLLSVGALLGLGLPKLRPWTGVAAAAGLAALIGAGTIGLVWGTHFWFPWLVICAVQIPLAVAFSLLLHTRRLFEEKQALERDLALAESVGNLPGMLSEGKSRVNLDAGPAGTVKLDGYPPPVARADQPPPIPNHRLLRRIGRGSYGEVWIALDDIGTYHAVKIVYRRSFSSASPYEREFRGIQKFTPISRSHPGFVHVLHVGRNDPEGYFFYIMELGDDRTGHRPFDPANYSPQTLAAMLEGGRLELRVCVRLGLELTAALKYLHEQQLIHRDIKPSNIVFVDRQPKFADIGLVADITPEGKRREATFVGTDGYIPPEGPGTVAADIYGLGKVLYEACTGLDRLEFPTLSGTLVASADQHLTSYNEIILKACHPDQSQRYQSASEFHADLLNLSGKL